MEIDTNPSKCDEIELRPLNCELEAHTRSDGSAMLAQGKIMHLNRFEFYCRFVTIDSDFMELMEYDNILFFQKRHSQCRK